MANKQARTYLLLAFAMTLMVTHGAPFMAANGGFPTKNTLLSINGTSNGTYHGHSLTPPLQLAQVSNGYPPVVPGPQVNNKTYWVFIGFFAGFIALAVLFPILFCGALYLSRGAANGDGSLEMPGGFDNASDDSNGKISFRMRILRRGRKEAAA
jgi:hypothetical protein